MALLCKIVLVFYKIWITTLVFKKNADFLAENGRKTQKTVITTSTPGLFPTPKSFLSRPWVNNLH
jgi:hypothetical protein